MRTIAFFLEELSAKVMLEGFINAHFRYDPAKFDFRYCVHEGKQGLGLRNSVKGKNKAFFREPDMIVQPSKKLEALTKGSYQKIDGSRKIAPFMNPQLNRSHSFRVLYKTLCDIFSGNSGHTEGG
jgi:hypothetical protein